MQFRIIGGKIEPIKRIPLGLYSFDRAFENNRGEIGIPIRGIVEIAGPTGCGKTTATLSLAGMLGAKENKDIGFAFIESFDPVTLTDILESTKFAGALHPIVEKTDEKTLDALVDILREQNIMVGIFDSIGAISPIAEVQGEIGEANMGKRAKALAQFSRKVEHLLSYDPHKIIFMNNHVHPKIGGRGTITPGGETTKYIATLNIRLKRAYYKNNWEEFPDGSYILEGKVEKNRFGFENRIFNLVVLGGKGIHPGLTAMYDCIQLKIAERGRGNKVTIGDTDFGTFRTIFGKAHEGNEDFFQPFFDALQTSKPDIEEIRTDNKEEINNDTESDNIGE